MSDTSAHTLQPDRHPVPRLAAMLLPLSLSLLFWHLLLPLTFSLSKVDSPLPVVALSMFLLPWACFVLYLKWPTNGALLASLLVALLLTAAHSFLTMFSTSFFLNGRTVADPLGFLGDWWSDLLSLQANVLAWNLLNFSAPFFLLPIILSARLKNFSFRLFRPLLLLAAWLGLPFVVFLVWRADILTLGLSMAVILPLQLIIYWGWLRRYGTRASLVGFWLFSLWLLSVYRLLFEERLFTMAFEIR